MSNRSFLRLGRVVLTSVLVLVACSLPSCAQERNQGKILGGYFEEWSIYYAGYNIANLQQNGVANKLTHLIYAFANVTTTPAPACSIADSWADYSTPYLPSVSGTPYTGPLYGNFAAIQQLKQLHPHLKVLMSMGGASAANLAAFVSASSTQAGRKALASSCIDMFVKGNIAPGITAPGLFDGFNIDWEFPTATDKQNFTALLKEFRSQLNALEKTTGKQYVLSFDGPAGAQNYVNIDSGRLPNRWTLSPSTATTTPDRGIRKPMTRRHCSTIGRIRCMGKTWTSMRPWMVISALAFRLGSTPWACLSMARVVRRSQDKPRVVSKLDWAVCCFAGQWNGAMHRHERQYGRLRHAAHSGHRDVLDARQSSCEWVHAVVRREEDCRFALQSDDGNLLHL